MEDLQHMLGICASPRGDHRHPDHSRHSSGEGYVKPKLGAVSVHAGEKDLSCSQGDGLFGSVDGVNSGELPAAIIGAFKPAGPLFRLYHIPAILLGIAPFGIYG